MGALHRILRLRFRLVIVTLSGEARNLAKLLYPARMEQHNIRPGAVAEEKHGPGRGENHGPGPFRFGIGIAKQEEQGDGQVKQSGKRGPAAEQQPKP